MIDMKDEEDEIVLGGVKIHYKFQANMFGVPHLEFESDMPNPLSSTGYLSHFFGEDEQFGSVKEAIDKIVGNKGVDTKQQRLVL